MEITCGTDIIEIKRIKEAIEELGDKFTQKIYTETEIDYCENKKNQNPVLHKLQVFVLFCQCCLIFDIAQKIVLGWYYEKNAKHSW